MITFDDISSARQAIAGKVRLTPVFSSEMLGRQIGARLFLKAELFQKTGSFKPRGVLNRLRFLTAEERARGLITISAGNHAAALAWGARQAGLPCTVVMHAAASRIKVAAAEGYGATVVLHGAMPEAFAKMDEIRREQGLTLIHPFDDPMIMAGQGTIGLEIVEQVPDVAKVIVGIGGGGLISGIALAVKTLLPGVKVYGVEPVGASAMRQSWDRGEAVRLDSVNTVADGLAPPMAGQLTYPMTRKYVDDIITIGDDDIIAGMKALMAYAKLYAEPAGSAAVAALLAGRIPLAPDDAVVAVVSGGNIDLDRLKGLL